MHSGSKRTRRGSRRNGSATHRTKGIGARAEQAGALSMSRIFSWETEGVALICLCYLEEVSPAQIRYALRRIRRRRPGYQCSSRCLMTPTKRVLTDELGNAEFVERSLNDVVEKILTIA